MPDTEKHAAKEIWNCYQKTFEGNIRYTWGVGAIIGHAKLAVPPLKG